MTTDLAAAIRAMKCPSIRGDTLRMYHHGFEAGKSAAASLVQEHAPPPTDPDEIHMGYCTTCKRTHGFGYDGVGVLVQMPGCREGETPEKADLRAAAERIVWWENATDRFSISADEAKVCATLARAVLGGKGEA